MLNKNAKLLATGQLSLFIGLGICYLLLPVFLHREGGVSNYGVHRQTVLPYSLGFALCTFFTVLAAKRYEVCERRLLYVLAGLYLLALISTYTYKLSKFLDAVHIIAGAVLFGFALLLAGYMAWHSTHRLPLLSLLLLQCYGTLAMLLTLLRLWHVLFVAQLFTGLVFGIILVLSAQIRPHFK